jgi:TatD DNase family protein
MNGFLFDSHTHLDIAPLSENPFLVVDRARKAGVGGMVTIGIDPESSRRNLSFAEAFDEVYSAAGIHPHNGEEYTEDALRQIEEISSHPFVVAIGETGLDFYRDYSDRDAQTAAFRAQLRLAKKVGKPVIIHNREAHREVLKIIDEEGVPSAGGVFHCFSGSHEFAMECVERGFLISVPGVVTYRNASILEDVVRKIPADRLLIETDAPYLTPHPHRGKPNEPSLIIHTALKVGEIKGLSLEDIARVTTSNALRLFSIQGELEYRVAYVIRESLYLNLTNRCTNRCVFCSKRKDYFVKGHYLKLSSEPSKEEVLESAEGAETFQEVVFCGFGEPTLRLKDMLFIAGKLKEKGVKKVRLNTDGLANLVHRKNVLPEMKGLIDSISVSMNAPDEKTYISICPNPYGEESFRSVLSFIREAKTIIPEVTATVVALPGLDIDRCRVLAEEELKVCFRVRGYNDVG